MRLDPMVQRRESRTGPGGAASWTGSPPKVTRVQSLLGDLRIPSSTVTRKLAGAARLRREALDRVWRGLWGHAHAADVAESRGIAASRDASVSCSAGQRVRSPGAIRRRAKTPCRGCSGGSNTASAYDVVALGKRQAGNVSRRRSARNRRGGGRRALAPDRQAGLIYASVVRNLGAFTAVGEVGRHASGRVRAANVFRVAVDIADPWVATGDALALPPAETSARYRLARLRSGSGASWRAGPLRRRGAAAYARRTRAGA